MSLVSPTQVSDGTTGDASDVNTPINQIAAVINGNIDNSNIPSGAAIDGSKLAANSIDIGAKASVFDGWIAVSDTWTYASATTVTVPSDATTKYSVGDKVKFTNSGAKFFYITAVSATTLTLNGGSDYTVANAAITVPYYSKASTPLSFPQWFNYTPTFANTTLGNGTATGRFTMTGKRVSFHASFTLGTTSAMGTGPTVTLPMTATATANDTGTGSVRVGLASYEDSAVAGYEGDIAINATAESATTATFLCWLASGTYVTATGLTAAVPFAWGTADTARCYGFYEAA